MIIIGIVLIVVGLGALVLSWQGFVVARGAFCKKCRFDLVGLDLDAADAKCPECGHDVSLQSNRRGMIRRSSKLGLIAAVLVLIGGIVTSWIWASANTPLILGVLPNSIVLNLTDLGMDAALDELVLRFSQVPGPLSTSQIEQAIEIGLAHQADTTWIWDPRWGEVLMIAAQNGHMSDEQIGSYIVNGHLVQIDLRQKLPEGTPFARTRLTTKTGRISSVSGGKIPYSMRSGFGKSGIDGQESGSASGGSSTSNELYIPGRRGVSSTGMYGSISLKVNDQLPVAGDQLKVFCETEMIIRSAIDDREIRTHQQRKEMTLSFVGLDEELITLVAPTVETMISSTIFIDNKIRVADRIPDDSEVIPYQQVMDFYILLKDVGQSISYEVFIRTKGGDEIPIGSLTSLGIAGQSSFGMQLALTKNEPKLNQRVRSAIGEMIERGEATILLRVDPVGALVNPDIMEILDQDLIFEHVGVQVEPLGDLNSFSDGSAAYPARALMEDEIDQ